MRWPVAALVQVDGRLNIVRSPRTPDAECLGGGASVALMHLILGRLHGITEFGQLPLSLGPHVTLDIPRAIPDGVLDPLKWVTNALPAKATNADESRTRQPTRHLHGQRFLETYRVAQYVQRHFNSTTNLGFTLSPITQWVTGKNHESALLLMEPLVVARDKFDSEVIEIATKFSAYKGEIARLQESLKREISFVAYLLPSDAKKQKDTVFEILHNKADVVVDTSVSSPRNWLINKIKTVSEAAQDLITSN